MSHHKIITWIIAAILAALAGNSAAAPCLTQDANATFVADCGEPPVMLMDDGKHGLKAQPLSAHQDEFGGAGKYSIAGPGQRDKPMRL